MSRKNRPKASERRRLGAFFHHVQGGSCYLCQRPVSSPEEWPIGVIGPSRPTIDHVVALSVGGTNAQTNLALAHERCNERRGSSPLSRAQKKMARVNHCAIMWVRFVRSVAISARVDGDSATTYQ